MIKIDVISGFTGSGKTSFIKRLIEQRNFENGPLAIIENDFGNVKLDAAQLSLSDIRITELNSGCVCCSLTGKFSEAVTTLLNETHPARIILEPSGAARLSDVLRTIDRLQGYLPVTIGSVITMAVPFRSLTQQNRFFGVYKNQLQNAALIVPGYLDLMTEKKYRLFIQTLKNDAEGVPVWNAPWINSDINALLSLGSRSVYKPSFQAEDMLLHKTLNNSPMTGRILFHKKY